MARKTVNKGISRIDRGSIRGWLVRGYRNGKTYTKLFSDGKCGGKGKAQKLAREYRDQLIAEIEKIPKAPRKKRVATSDSRNKTGELGVTRITKTGPTGRTYDCYTVSWRPATGVQKCTSFSVKKYGERGAFKRAVEFRRNKMREIHGKDFYRKLAVKKRARAPAPPKTDNHG